MTVVTLDHAQAVWFENQDHEHAGFVDIERPDGSGVRITLDAGERIRVPLKAGIVYFTATKSIFFKGSSL